MYDLTDVSEKYVATFVTVVNVEILMCLIYKISFNKESKWSHKYFCMDFAQIFPILVCKQSVFFSIHTFESWKIKIKILKFDIEYQNMWKYWKFLKLVKTLEMLDNNLKIVINQQCSKFVTTKYQLGI